MAPAFLNEKNPMLSLVGEKSLHETKLSLHADIIDYKS